MTKLRAAPHPDKGKRGREKERFENVCISGLVMENKNITIIGPVGETGVSRDTFSLFLKYRRKYVR